MPFTFTHALAVVLLGWTPPSEVPVKPDCCCQSADARTWVVIDENRVVLSPSQLPDTDLEKLPQGTLVVACRQFRSEAVTREDQVGIRLHCEDVHFLTGRGLRGRASYLAYDSASGMLELRGDDGQPAGLVWESPAEDDMSLVATAMVINLKSSKLQLQETAALDPPDTTCKCTASACAGGACCTSKQAATPGQTIALPACNVQANEIDFDASRGLYILSTEGGGSSTVWHQDHAGAGVSRSDGQRIEFTPGYGHLRVLRATGLFPCFDAPCATPEDAAPAASSDADHPRKAPHSAGALQFDVFRSLR